MTTHEAMQQNPQLILMVDTHHKLLVCYGDGGALFTDDNKLAKLMRETHRDADFGELELKDRRKTKHRSLNSPVLAFEVTWIKD
ncbi:MAG: hypothetical protein RQ714_07340 [Nitrosomonas sp.]|nr:hypothetical protein [Nitrosomonas sp.]